jgi:hypothetical protein
LKQENPESNCNSNPGSNDIDSDSQVQVHCRFRNVALAAASGYGLDVLVPLVESFQRFTTPCDDMVLFSNDVPKNFKVQRPGNLILAPLDPKVRVHEGRFGSILSWMKENGHKYRYAITLDSRDSFFQANPFEPLFGQKGLFSVAEKFELAAETRWNQGWIRNCFGQEKLDELLREQPNVHVVCVGLVMGDSAAFTDYVEILSSFLSNNSCTGTDFKDQGVHEYFVLKGLKEMYPSFKHQNHILDPETSRYSHDFKPQVLVDNLGRYCNAKMEPYAIIHQLDRNAEMWRKHLSLYPVESNPGLKDSK